MKRIVIFSDIHIPTRLKEFPFAKIKNIMGEIDLVFGLGDYINQNTLDILYGFGKSVYAVVGNMDDFNIKNILPTKIKLEIEKIRIGLIHGWGAPWDLREKLLKEFDNVDLICYGHTHEAFKGKIGNVMFFNPGSICGDKSSFGIIEIEGDKVNMKIIGI